MFIHKQDPLDPVGGTETPEVVYLNRRKWLRAAGLVAGAGLLGGGGYLGWRVYRGSDEAVISSGQVFQGVQKQDVAEPGKQDAAGDETDDKAGAETQDDAPLTKEEYEQQIAGSFPAPRDDRFEYGRTETERVEAARYTNFYEFSSTKSSWRYVDNFQPYPWTVEVGGLCRNEMKLDMADFHRLYAADLVERQYRHRCVETWAMAVPWTGIPLAKLIEHADPLPGATHVLFTSFLRPDEAPQQRNDQYPWPYLEGLTLPEAMNKLTLLATGIYGQPLLKQHGAPIRLVVPWKYGFKSSKSIQRIEFLDREPPTFWSTLAPDAYPFEANVEPEVPRPWPQDKERMLGSGEIFPTQLYNGYEEYVADLYQA